ncbi:iron uptake system protein EfeO [Paenibacillus athensensis]|uniref:iron uptake system protein EfeO n=1 Tax=Paenibacillus athensensis TaxID=1967502 RepID=UPI001E43E590|nr:iron uptake system protein EfeO [Paenibacillus athensensis]
MKKTLAVGCVSLAAVLILSACGQDAATTASPSPSPAAAQTQQPAASEQNPIQTGTTNMLAETKKLQDAIGQKNAEDVKKLGKSINDIWLSYESVVRQKFPLEYTDVEKYEMPIYSASAYDKIDFDALKTTADQLVGALTKLQNAKETTGNTSELLNKAVEGYQAYVIEQVDKLYAQTKTFADAVKAGNADLAKNEYIKARLYYENIEPIAESIGELDPKIDARLADVENEADWTGFHRIEKALWLDNKLDGQDKYADQLLQDVQALQAQVKSLKLEPKAMVAGAMELLNEAATSKITGEEELYSHIDLVDLAGNVEGSKAVYLAIIPALNEKNPDLGAQIDKQFQLMEQKLMTYQKDGQYVTYDKLTTEQIRELSDQLSQLSTLMTQTASIL